MKSNAKYVALVSGYAIQTILDRIGIAGVTDLKLQKNKGEEKMKEEKMKQN